jgi:alpha-beta hydrolase superfamily lysophospholipase
LQHSTFYRYSRRGQPLFTQAWQPDLQPKLMLGLVHGLGEHSSRYTAMAKVLNQAGIGVVSYDQPGHGRTGGALPAFASLQQELGAFVDWLRGEFRYPLMLFGQSLGGCLVLHQALRHPESCNAVVASSPLLTTTHPPPPWKLLVAKTLGCCWPNLTLPNGIDPDDLSHDPESVKEFRKDRLIHHRVSAALGLSMLDAGRWALAHAEQLAIPTLLMHGTADRITSAASSELFAQRAGPRCHLRLWAGLYHELHFEAERSEILGWLIHWLHAQADPIDA